jgi:hypothetical protein
MSFKSVFLLLILAGSFLFGLSSCRKNDNSILLIPEACGVKDPINNLPWLKLKIQTFKDVPLMELYQYRYNASTIFVFYSSLQSCMECESYDCEGKKIQWTSYQTQQDFMTKRTDKRLLWKVG